MARNAHLQQLLVHHQIPDQPFGTLEFLLQGGHLRIIGAALQRRQAAFQELVTSLGQYGGQLPCVTAQRIQALTAQEPQHHLLLAFCRPTLHR